MHIDLFSSVLPSLQLQRVALEVLLFLGCNIEDATKNDMDRETLSCLLKLRSYKSKMVRVLLLKNMKH